MTDKKVLLPGPDHPITLEKNPSRVVVEVGGRTIADTRDAVVLQEADYPPVQYIPFDDVDPEVLEPSDHTTYCPYKGDASYRNLRLGDRVVENALWSYEAPHDPVASIKGHVAFYPNLVDRIGSDGDA